jgi:hypothetical protein
MADDQVVEQFNAAFGRRPGLLVRSPGRVNLIGEHTDYNDGWAQVLVDMMAGTGQGPWLTWPAASRWRTTRRHHELAQACRNRIQRHELRQAA